MDDHKAVRIAASQNQSQSETRQYGPFAETIRPPGNSTRLDSALLF